MDYEPDQPTSHLHHTILSGLAPLQGQNLMDPYILAQVQAVIEDAVWQLKSTATVRLEYVDAASLLAVYSVEGLMISTVRVTLATPDARALITYKLVPGHVDKKAEQEPTE